MNDELSNKIIEQIDAEKISPRPYWYFVSLRVIFWIFAFLSVIVGSLAVGAMLFLFVDYHAHGLSIIPHDLTEFLLLIPYIWLIVFVLFIIIGRESIKHTKRGYKYRLYAIVSVSVFLSFIFGSIFNFIGGGKTVHESLSRVPLYAYVTYDSRDAWDQPGIGRLAGIVTFIKDKNDFSIIDFNGHIWQVRLAASTNSNNFTVEASSTVRISGFLDPLSNTFIAKSIVEWEE